MIREIRILLALRPIYKKLGETMKLNFSWHMITQVVALAIQGANAIGGIMPEHQQAIALVIGAIQAIMGALAHFTNPDGTPASQPFVKP